MVRTDLNRDKKPYNRPVPRPQGADGQWVHDRAPGAVRAAQKVAAVRGNSIINTRILVSNLHYEVTPNDLNRIFGQIGTLVREPQIRYDRSGRSSGVAVITFETPGEATRAKNQFHGIFCKNQPMTIVYDNPPAGPKGRHGKASLLNRIEKPPLLDRLDDKTEPRLKQAALPRGGRQAAGVGPIRTAPRGGVRASKAKPKTEEELDNELDAYLQETAALPPATKTTASGDVDMMDVA